MSVDYYKLLGISPSATRAEIVKAFRKKALESHPDKNASPEAKEKFQEISFAYRMLLKQIDEPKNPLTTADDLENDEQEDTHKHRSYKAAKTAEERAERIKKAQQLAKEKEEKEREEALAYHHNYLKSTRYKISSICAALCIFTGVLLTLDYVLPYKTEKTIVQQQTISLAIKGNILAGEQTTYQNTVVIDNQTLILNEMDFHLTQKNDSVVVQKTPIFNDIMDVAVIKNGKFIDDGKPSENVHSIIALILLLPVFNFYLKGPTPMYHFTVIINLIIPNIALIYALLENNRLLRLFGI